MIGQPINHRLQQLTAAAGDLFGGIKITEMALGKTEIPVERVDQDLERLLQGLEMAFPVSVPCLAGRGFCGQPKRPQVAQ